MAKKPGRKPNRAKVHTPKALGETPTALEAPVITSEADRWAKKKAKRDAARKLKNDMGTLGEQKLNAPVRDGFYRRWANDDGNNLAKYEGLGYDFVRKDGECTEGIITTDEGDKFSQLVGMTKTGQPMRAYLMEIPSEWRDEDQEKREDSRRSREKDMKRGGGNQMRSADGSSVAYVPNQGSSHFDV